MLVPAVRETVGSGPSGARHGEKGKKGMEATYSLDDSNQGPVWNGAL